MRRGYKQRPHIRRSIYGTRFMAGHKIPYEQWLTRNRTKLHELWVLFKEETHIQMSFEDFAKGTYEDPVKLNKHGYEITGLPKQDREDENAR